MDPAGAKMSFGVANSRLPMYCTYSQKPEGLATAAPMSAFTGAPQTRMLNCPVADPVIANSRLMVIPPRLRRIYADLDPEGHDDDGEDDPAPYEAPTIEKPARQRVDSYLNEIMKGKQMDDFESETRKIRQDAEALLKRLSASTNKKPTRLSSTYFPDLNYSTSSSSAYAPRSYVPPKEPEKESSPDTDDFYRPKPRRSYVNPRIMASRDISPPSYSRRSVDRDRDSSPEMDSYHPLYKRPIPTLAFVPRRPLAYDPATEALTEINRKTQFDDNLRKVNDCIRGTTSRVGKKDDVPDDDTVRNSINIRAKYALKR